MPDDLPPIVRRLAYVTLLVRDYDEAIAFFTEALRFNLIEDTPLSGGKRWVIVAPEEGASLLLDKAATPEQQDSIGRQAGGRVAFILNTTDFWGDYTYMQWAGVKFEEPPREEPHSTWVVFHDLYGNRWELIEPKGAE